MSTILFKSADLLDPHSNELIENIDVVVEGGLIKEVGAGLSSASAEVLDISGKTLMPGLVDAHVHVVASEVNVALNAELPSSLIALRASKLMNSMLMRGFTTVRDLAGADLGMKLAVEEGLIDGPRLVICGKALGQTGGHIDYRSRHDDRPLFEHRLGSLGRICDGVDEVRRGSREEIRAGADFIKIMANGGVASPNDPIHVLQYSRDEIVAIVEEAENAGTYVSAHVYTDKAIRRAVECGVHSLEHCNLIEAETAKLAAAAGAIACPTLAAYEGLAWDGEAFGLGPESVAKIDTVRRGGLESLKIMYEAGLPMAFGSDLLGQLHKYQSIEFSIRNRVLPAHEIIRSATLVSAKLCLMEGKIGVIAPGAYADLLVIDGNPIKDITRLEQDGKYIQAIMKGGKFYKNNLSH